MRELKLLYHTLALLHEKYPDVDKSVDDLEAMVSMAYPNMRQTEKEAVHELLQNTRQLEVSDAIIYDLVKSLQIRADSAQLALKALDVAEGRAEVQVLDEIFSRIKKPSEEALDDFANYLVTDDLFTLESSSIRVPGLRWRLDCLNRSLGPLRPGDFGFVFARLSFVLSNLLIFDSIIMLTC